MNHGPATVDIERLANLLTHLSPEQRETLAIRLDVDAMRQIEETKRDLEAGNTVPFDEW